MPCASGWSRSMCNPRAFRSLMASLMRFFVCVSGLFALLGRAATATLLNANEIPFSQQTYAFDPENLCRLLAHESEILQDLESPSHTLTEARIGIVLKNDQHDFIVLDGGFGKFKHGSDIEVVDMSEPSLPSCHLCAKLSTTQIDTRPLSTLTRALRLPIKAQNSSTSTARACNKMAVHQS